MSDGAIVLIGSGYYLDCPRPCLTEAKDAKGISFSSVSTESAISISSNSAFVRGTFV